MNVKTVVTSALMAVAFLPATAFAGTATLDNGAFTYTAAPGRATT